MAQKILITGASGLIGNRLTELLLQQGREVVHLGRGKKRSAVPHFTWDVSRGIMDVNALKGVEAIVHLAGAGIADERWTEKRKKEIIDSRILSARLLYDTLSKGPHSVNCFVSASAIGFYGAGDASHWFTENDPAGSDFLARVTRQWEQASDNIPSLGIRLVKMRTGIVLSDKGGALKSMAAPIKLGFGAALGDGTQYVSWLHLDDLCLQYIKAIDDKTMNGPYNAVGKNPATNRELTKAIARVLGRPLWLPGVPFFVLKILLGEMATTIVTGSKVSPDKILRTGFEFRYPDLEAALKNLFDR